MWRIQDIFAYPYDKNALFIERMDDQENMWMNELMHGTVNDLVLFVVSLLVFSEQQGRMMNLYDMKILWFKKII